MENLESRLKNAPYFCCEKGNGSVSMCQKCETCTLAWKIFSTKEWFRRINEISQRRFLVSILEQLDSLYLLHYFQNILQTTQGKDFIYNRSRINLSKEENIVKSSLNQTLEKTVEQKMREILYWFQNSTHWTKVNYTLLLLQMCDPKLLLTAADVIRALFQREWNNIAEGQWKPPLQCTSEMNRLFSGKADLPKAGCTPSDLLVDLDTVRDLSSGVSKHRDFICHLPIHLSKYILSMLDKNTLNRCASVSQHWAALAQQVKIDLSMHTFIQDHVALLQGAYTWGIDPKYASKLFIPVPKMTDDGKHMCVKTQKWKLRMKNDYNLWNAYQNQETQQVLMEERNVFCGTYNIRILSDTWDRNRIIHYSGGDLVAVSSNRKIQLLDILQAHVVPMKFRGHAGSVQALFLCEDENFLLSGSYDLSIREVLHVALLFLRVISACADGKIRIYNFLNGNCLKVMKANGRGDPVLSFFIQGNRILINTESNILMFQFENINWQYSLERPKQKKNKEEAREENSLTEVLSKSSTQAYSLGDSISSKQMVVQESLLTKPHQSCVFLKAATLPTAVSTEAPQSQGKSRSPGRDGRKRASPVSKEANDDVAKVQKQGQLETLGDLTSYYSKKKSWQIPMSPDRFLLTVNALQQAHNSGEFAYPRRPQTQLTDVWRPSILHPRKVLNVKGKAVQRAVDRLRISNPPIDVKQINIPLEIQKLQPNLKNSLQSPRVQSTIPQPMIIRSRFSGSLKGKDRATSSTDGAVRSFRPLTSMHTIKPNRMLAPPVGVTTQSVKEERPCFHKALNPFRLKTEFMLLTVKEEKEYGQAKMKEYQARKSLGGVNPEKASKAAWIRKIKGLPIDNFMKQGKTAAPELGPNIFI
ncbi:F-box and WD repeat domain containing protein 10B isoform 10-T10 [Hipposideros larvatus]